MFVGCWPCVNRGETKYKSKEIKCNKKDTPQKIKPKYKTRETHEKKE